MNNNEIDELPELTEEMLSELKNTDLHLGAAEVKQVDHDWFIKKYGPKPPGPGIIALDVLIIALFLIFVDIFILSWIYVFN